MKDFDRRFTAGVPSLVKANRLVVNGDVRFGERVVVEGEVEVTASQPAEIPAGTVLTGSVDL